LVSAALFAVGLALGPGIAQAQQLSINDVTVTEGPNDVRAIFTVTLTRPANSSRRVRVEYATQNVTATAGSDYSRVSGRLEFEGSRLTRTITVPIINNNTAEPTETFNVVLRRPDRATIAKGTGVGTILDDDAPPAQVCNIAVAPTTLAFGTVNIGASRTLSTTVSNSGTAACNVTLTRTGTTEFAVTAPLSFSVAAGASSTVSVSYTPTNTGADTGTLAVASNDPDTPNVNVALTGTGQQVQQQVCNIAVTPTALAFGNVTVGNTATRSSTVSNSGTAACSVTLARTGSADFAITSATSFNVAPGASSTVSVNYTPGQVGADTGNVAVNSNDPDTATVNVGLTGNGVQQQVNCVPANLALSINSTSQNGCPDATVPQQTIVNNATSAYSVLAINDLGMHCGDLDTRVSSILPPFQVLLAQVVQKTPAGATTNPVLNPAGVTVFYSAASNPNDPILASNTFAGRMADGRTFKTNFWDFPIPAGTYDAFYPAFNPFNPGQTLTPLAGAPFNVTHDIGLPVPNVEDLYLGPDGIINSGDESLTAVLHPMPGILQPYRANDPKQAQEHYLDKPFFANFPFGYVAAGVNWYEGAGIPFAAFDDNGRENAYPLVRVQARNAAGANVATVDTVLPISGEASCTNCHADPADVQNSRTPVPTQTLRNAGLPVAVSLDDPDPNLPIRVSVEWAADINVLRLHDLRHGARYVTTACDNVPAGENCLNTAPAPCTINAANPNGSASCLTNQALVQNKPVVCQVCHYTPALDLAQLGPLAGAPGTIANGRNQLAHQSNSRVMHNHHGSLPNNLFPPIPPPAQNAAGIVTNQDARLAAMEQNCYQCHPGTNVQCLRGAMFNGAMLCSDCHGSMQQVGADFSAGVSPTNPGAFVLNQGNFYDPASNQPRVPWANEPGCGSCHTGDANNNLTATGNVRVNTADVNGNVDNIRLRQAYRNGDGKATPIVPTNKRFAEPAVPATFNGTPNPGAGNPQLYRVSTGHGGVMCEGCHGATHAEWPNANPNSNDNIAARQLQGHTGTLIECQTCHGTRWNNGNTLNGPHGMHPVGNDTNVTTGTAAGPQISFVDGGHQNLGGNLANCSGCHGPGNRGSNVGTVLSVAKKDRRLNGQTIPAGTPIGCTICH
jgi:hypothetical protein